MKNESCNESDDKEMSEANVWRFKYLLLTLVEVHKELAKTTREAKEIAEVCKRTTKASDQMDKEWSLVKKTNQVLR